MSDYDTKIKDTQALYKRLRHYFERFLDRKTALLDNGVLQDLTARDHTINEWLYDIDQRLKVLESVLADSTGSEHEQPVEIPTFVDHLRK